MMQINIKEFHDNSFRFVSFYISAPGIKCSSVGLFAVKPEGFGFDSSSLTLLQVLWFPPQSANTHWGLTKALF